MTTTVSTLARDLQITDRTLRRALEQGLLRAERPSPRKVEITFAEKDYLRRNWGLLARLRETLRTEPGVALAVLYGSRARGDEHNQSDIDLLVSFRGERPGGRRRMRELSDRLTDKLGADVQIVSVADAETAPLLLAEVVRDGRVLVDRDDTWSRLVRRRNQIFHAAAAEHQRIDERFETTFATAGRA